MTDASSTTPQRHAIVEVVATYQEAPTGPLKLPFVTNPYVSMAASFRSLRHRMQTLTKARVVAITSPNREEGKTTCALNLAMAFAEHGVDDVLLIEGNLQHASIAAGLGFSPPSCFAEQMLAAVDVGASYTWHAVAAYFPNLHVLAVDPTRTKQGHLNGAAFTHAMHRMQSSYYQHVIVDCPQVFGSADMSIIQDCVDGVLFAGQSGVTKGSELRKASELLQPANILGTVLMQRQK
jgi:Mrp family chromosome partitioning ATPase